MQFTIRCHALIPLQRGITCSSVLAITFYGVCTPIHQRTQARPTPACGGLCLRQTIPIGYRCIIIVHIYYCLYNGVSCSVVLSPSLPVCPNSAVCPSHTPTCLWGTITTFRSGYQLDSRTIWYIAITCEQCGMQAWSWLGITRVWTPLCWTISWTSMISGGTWRTSANLMWAGWPGLECCSRPLYDDQFVFLC